MLFLNRYFLDCVDTSMPTIFTEDLSWRLNRSIVCLGLISTSMSRPKSLDLDWSQQSIPPYLQFLWKEGLTWSWSKHRQEVCLGLVSIKKSRSRLVSKVLMPSMPTIFTEGRLDMVLIKAWSRSLSWSRLDQKVSISIGLNSRYLHAYNFYGRKAWLIQFLLLLQMWMLSELPIRGSTYCEFFAHCSKKGKRKILK